MGRTKQNTVKPRNYDNWIILFLILAGIAGALFTIYNVNKQNRESLLKRARTVAISLPQEDIQRLSGIAQDTSKPSYQSLKEKLTKIQEANKDVRFAYLTGIRGDEVFFYVDSEQPNSPDYSPPGQTYTEASSGFRETFKSGEPIVEGPYNDRWGNWLSALAPVKNDKGEVIAIAGIDSPAKDYYWEIAAYSFIPILLVTIPIGILLRQRKLRDKEQELSLLKTRFVSIASHELRSPLNGILWAIQTMLKKPANPKQEEMLTDMYVSAELSLATINEILDLSIFERGKADNMHHDPVDLLALISEVQKTVKLAAQENNIVIRITKNWPTEARVVGDAGALKRAIMNIVSNAIKYSPATSQVTIDYRTEGGQHVISIEDSGIGIPKDELNKVMSGYYRAKNTEKVNAHGTGLGLWVSQLIIEQHKGKIWIESQENVGTTVYISLPALTAKIS